MKSCYRILALGLLLYLGAGAQPGKLNPSQAAKLRKSGLLVLLPEYVPRGFVVAGLELNSLQYRISYVGPKGASFSVWGRKSGVCDGGPAEQHFAVKRGPFRGEVVEYENRVFYTGFLKLKPAGGETSPSFDVEGKNLSAREAVKIVEGLRRLESEGDGHKR
ncbi:hypothetical protein JST97_34160 [bacterium]|nr:hypothetical protein [bacterium]